MACWDPLIMYSWVCFFAVEEISYMLLFLCRGSSVIPRRQSQHFRTSHRRVLWYYWLIFALLCFPTGFKLQLSYLLSKNFILNRFHLYNPFGPAPLICLFNKIYIVPLMLECFFFFEFPKSTLTWPTYPAWSWKLFIKVTVHLEHR